MFVIKVKASTGQAKDVRRQVLAWPADVGPSATGWLGLTSGVSDAGEWIFLLRFVSQEAAWITSDLPEYEAWWRSCRNHLEGPPVFEESTHVLGIFGGGSDEASAVMVIEGSAPPHQVRDRLRRLQSVDDSERRGLIGGIVAWHGRTRLTEVLYLTEPVARSSDAGTRSLELSHSMDDLLVNLQDSRMVALHEPVMTGPRKPRPGRPE
jgi:hypothetical protein